MTMPWTSTRPSSTLSSSHLRISEPSWIHQPIPIFKWAVWLIWWPTRSHSASVSNQSVITTSWIHGRPIRRWSSLSSLSSSCWSDNREPDAQTDAMGFIANWLSQERLAHKRWRPTRGNGRICDAKNGADLPLFFFFFSLLFIRVATSARRRTGRKRQNSRACPRYNREREREREREKEEEEEKSNKTSGTMDVGWIRPPADSWLRYIFKFFFPLSSFLIPYPLHPPLPPSHPPSSLPPVYYHHFLLFSWYFRPCFISLAGPALLLVIIAAIVVITADGFQLLYDLRFPNLCLWYYYY